MEKLTEERAAKILQESEVPAGRKLGMPTFAVHTEIDTTPQPLRNVRPFFVLELSVPPELPSLAREVIIRLFRCFARFGRVDEGLIGDLMFGFSQPTKEEPPLSPEATFTGLKQLEKLDYISFQAKDGAYIDAASDKITSAWVRYKPKLLGLVYERAN
jgi:hypothetical protein